MAPGPSLASAPTSLVAPSRGPSHARSSDPSPISHGRTAPLSRARLLTGGFPGRELWHQPPIRARLWSSSDPKLRSPVDVELAQVRSSSTFGLCSSQPMPISLQAELVSTTPAASRRPWCFSWRPSGYASLCLWSCSLTAAITSPTVTLSPFFKSPSHLLGPPATTVVEHCSTSSMHEQQQPRASSASRHQPAR
uniref:Uncharacterized protein n=1 Tax=Zea mays TaxID=4577 RepID=B6SUX6_MAIZE|nr:hypothetical protein [Zea mays]ACG28676.1 hypothetical protein [Zea mays]